MGDEVRAPRRLLTAVHLDWMFLPPLPLRQPVPLYFCVTPEAPRRAAALLFSSRLLPCVLEYQRRTSLCFYETLMFQAAAIKERGRNKTLFMPVTLNLPSSCSA